MPRLLGDLGGRGDVALIGVGVLALAADMEAERGRVAHLVDEADDLGGAVLHDAELDAEIVGLQRLAGLEAGGDLDVARRRDDRRELVELLRDGRW